MIMHFADRLLARIRALDSRVCVGLDPDLSRLPLSILDPEALGKSSGLAPEAARERAAQAAQAFCMGVIDAVAEWAVAVKPQCAHFEMLGWPGMRALAQVCARAKAKGLVVILDGKRGDIGSTASHYAQAYLGPEWTSQAGGAEAGHAAKALVPPAVPVDAVTVNPYMGLDSVEPFTRYCHTGGKGVFILVRTSNPSAADFQDLRLADGSSLAEVVAGRVDAWGAGLVGECGYSAVCAVVGATSPAHAEGLRRLMPRTIFLMPGFGAQGGGVEALVRSFGHDGQGVLVSASRSILYPCAPDDSDYFERVAEAVRAMRLALNRALPRD